MSIEKITSKIISDAEETAKVTLDQAKSQSDAILEKAKKEAEKIVKSAEIKGLDEKEKLISRRKAVADIDGRKIVLDQKQQLISQCFQNAVDSIISMDKEKYVDFLAQTVKSTGITEGELIFNEKERETVGPALVEKLEKDLPESKIVLSQETQKMKGGFLLKKGAVFINGTIEALVEEAKEDLVGEVAKELFQ